MTPDSLKKVAEDYLVEHKAELAEAGLEGSCRVVNDALELRIARLVGPTEATLPVRIATAHQEIGAFEGDLSAYLESKWGQLITTVLDLEESKHAVPAQEGQGRGEGDLAESSRRLLEGSAEPREGGGAVASHQGEHEGGSAEEASRGVGGEGEGPRPAPHEVKRGRKRLPLEPFKDEDRIVF